MSYNDFNIFLNNTTVFGLSIFHYFLFFIFILFLILFNSYIANLFILKIKSLVHSTGTKIDDHLFNELKPPLKFFPLVIITFLFSFYLDKDNNFGFYYFKINYSVATIFTFWFMHRLLVPFSVIFNKLEKSLSKAVVSWIVNSIGYLIIFLGVASLLEIWGVKVGPIIAGLGLLGVAVALGAQDLFKNLISGIMILLEKRFHIGDVINVPGHSEGTVEHIGFRSTLIRKFDSTPITIPNYIFAEAPILNYSNRINRRINWLIGLEYNSQLEQIKNFTSVISDYIKYSDDFIVNNDFKSFVRLDKFNDSSIDILIYCFTSTNDWEIYLRIKENLALKIKEEVEKVGLSFAFPSQSVYLENFSKEESIDK